MIQISLAKEAMPYLNELLQNAKKLKVNISEINEATIIDCGIAVSGSLAAGVLFSKISLGGLAEVRIDFPAKEIGNEGYKGMPIMHVETSHPVLATIGCQAASWNISKGDFFGMVCGPGRALAKKPSRSYKLIEYEDRSDVAILCIESDQMPTEAVIDYLSDKCSVEKKNLKILMIRTGCLVEYVQMAARPIELGIFKLVEQLGYPKERVLHAIGTGVIPPIIEDDEISNDRVNNGLIYGTRLFLIVKSDPADNLEELIPKIPSASSPSFGKKFVEIFEEAGRDFANFDLKILAPTEIIVNDIRTGKIFQEGKMDLSYLC